MGIVVEIKYTDLQLTDEEVADIIFTQRLSIDDITARYYELIAKKQMI